jgi:hypothetical protein
MCEKFANLPENFWKLPVLGVNLQRKDTDDFSASEKIDMLRVKIPLWKRRMDSQASAAYQM